MGRKDPLTYILKNHENFKIFKKFLCYEYFNLRLTVVLITALAWVKWLLVHFAPLIRPNSFLTRRRRSRRMMTMMTILRFLAQTSLKLKTRDI